MLIVFKWLSLLLAGAPPLPSILLRSLDREETGKFPARVARTYQSIRLNTTASLAAGAAGFPFFPLRPFCMKVRKTKNVLVMCSNPLTPTPPHPSHLPQ